MEARLFGVVHFGADLFGANFMKIIFLSSNFLIYKNYLQFFLFFQK